MRRRQGDKVSFSLSPRPPVTLSQTVSGELHQVFPQLGLPLACAPGRGHQLSNGGDQLVGDLWCKGGLAIEGADPGWDVRDSDDDAVILVFKRRSAPSHGNTMLRRVTGQ